MAPFAFEDGRDGRIWPPPRPEGWTYFLQAVTSGGPIKIGKATNIGERFRGLQGGNHLPLRFLGALPYEEVPERLLHGIFRKWHVRGEWFDPEPTILRLADLGNEHFQAGFKMPRGRQTPNVRRLSEGLRLGTLKGVADLAWLTA